MSSEWGGMSRGNLRGQQRQRKQTCAFGEKDVKAQNVHDDWAERQQAERLRARNGDENTADDFRTSTKAK